MKPAILAAMPLPPELLPRLAEHYTLLGPYPAGPLPPEARAARALVTLGGLRTDAALLAALPNLGLVACYGTGFEGVDQAAAGAAGVSVTHAPDANATAVAEFAMGLVLAASRDILRGDSLVRSGGWTSLRIDRMPLTPGLAGRRLGIYGLGAIGLKIAARAAAFEMTIGYHNRGRRPGLDYHYLPTLHALAEWADVLVVAVRASAENQHAINEAVLRALGPDGVLVNVARGSVVDEAALAEALAAGTIAAAGLDVYEHEPQVSEALRTRPNAVLTPHMAALSRSAQAMQQQILLDSLAAFFAGRPLRYRVPT
jgi:lactate dehydrogenase-like 2-hydroxyacid dehydrogenase